MDKFLKIGFLLLLGLVLQNLIAQSIYLQSHFIESNKSNIKTFKKQADILTYLEELVKKKQNAGYWQYSVDSFYCTKDTCFAQIFEGNKHFLQSNITVSKKTTQLDFLKLKVQLDKQLQKLENSGYPFAQILQDSIHLNKDSISIAYKIDTGQLILVDSFINHENARISKGFIQNYIGIKSGKPYNESKIVEIDKLLAKLPYTELKQPSDIYFHEDKADIHLYLKKRKVNKFDFIVGFLPNSSNSNKLMITGEARIHLQNAFKRGEELFFEWTRLHPNTQRLNLKFQYPFLLNTQLGINTSFQLEKRDSTSLDLNLNLGVPYFFKTNNYFKGFYKYAQTIILQADTNFVKSFKRLPGNLDATYNQYGVELYFETLDYLLNPRKGVELRVSTSVGTKKLKTNNQILAINSNDGFNYPALYDSIKKKSLKAELFWNINYYLPFGKRSTIKMSQNGGSVFNNNILRNELLRIGGNKLLRGFDEESIYASTYIVNTLEYRLLLQKNAYMSVFYDFAYVREQFQQQIKNNFPFGFGIGINFESKIGIFGLSYALGQQKNQPISFRNSKIHFGYVALF
ncbi:MAG TPA: ShlB/FhaC/HecB family hemolysin secretion/activation protein [Chitinophagales bacterium]|nr:hypothetical protein [Chitinophagales bacterium]HMU97945.1 ShlB/FhaC/HecB family hemolysin secretion/activation protein [Chitinophagales bacterium]HMV02902.1 ShlB/FhaC/HecB family hemolysin secretion/activation protein [Chitinophagales bacterium]HMW93532.1 ShlB/FhaC/HecB family hemolysin secretion/activation protein [Chitinophagales bacterium]HMY42542.1 ShlB/FhaC/HecB family hemolysin secretion/activation protein [Chitinophagales bacterium]